MAVVKKGDILIFGEDTVFQVLEQIEFESKNYIYGYIVPTSIVEAIDPVDFETMFLTEKVNLETKEVFMEKVEDKNLVMQLRDITKQKLHKDNKK